MTKTILAWLIKIAGRVARFEIWPVGVGVLLATASAELAPWGLAVLALVWGARWLSQGRLTIPTPLDWPAGVLLGMGGASWWVTVNREATFIALSRLMAGLSLMYSVANWGRGQAHRALLTRGLTWGALLLALATPLVIPWPQFGAWYDCVPHLWGAPLNPNMVAGTLAMVLPFPLVISVFAPCWISPPRPHLTRAGKLWRAVNTVTVLLILGALYLTQSRGGWLGIGAAAFVLGTGYTRHFLWALLAPVMAAGWLLLRGQMRAFLDALGTGGMVAGWPERVKIWQRALYMIQQFPLAGAGANTYPHILSLFPFLPPIYSQQAAPHAHNLYLQVTLDVGIPGLIAFLAGVLVAFFCAARGIRQNGADPPGKSLAWAGCASLVAMLTHGLVDATTWIVGWGAPMPWLVIGLLLAIENHSLEV